MGIGAAIGGIVGGISQASAAKKAAKAQSKAAEQQLALQREMFDLQRSDLSPFRDLGNQGIGALAYETGIGERPEGYAGFEASPGYQWRVDQGINALDQSAASRGEVFSGNTMKAAMDYNQGQASDEYNNYYNRLANTVSIGQNAAAMSGQAAQNLASGGSNALANKGNAQAAGAVGVGNAINGTIGNVLSAWQYQKGTQA